MKKAVRQLQQEKTSQSSEEKMEEDTTKQEEAQDDKMVEDKTTDEKPQAEKTEEEKTSDEKIQDEKTAEEKPQEKTADGKTSKERPQEEAKADAEQEPDEQVSSEQPEPAPTSGYEGSTPPSLEDDYAALRDYKDAYEKVLSLETGEITYSILEQSHEEDHSNIKYGAGVGATHRTMSAREKEAEFKRWQTALLAKIPDQPTFAELGLQKRVYNLEARRKRLAGKEKKEPAKKKSKKEDGGDEDMKEDDTAAELEDKSSSKKKSKKAEQATKQEQDEAKDTSFEPPAKPISLAAVPSFYDQDLKRIRLIQGDLMSTFMADHVRQRVAETTNAYNAALQRSSEIYQQHLRLQSDLNSMMQQHRLDITKTTNEYKAKVAVERAMWQKRKDEWERQRNQKILQSMYGQQSVGTPQTQTAAGHPDQNRSTVGSTLSHIVDAVVLKAEQGDTEKFEDFVPPPAPNVDNQVVDPSTGETLEQRREKAENTLRQNTDTLKARFQKAEQERERAWKKMEKTKNEFDVGRRQMHGGVSPMPPIRASSIAAMPSSYAYALPDIPSYIPPTRSRPRIPPSQNESKYSAARVRERIRPDGCVEPVGELKRDSNGNFMRPAGRTRKGMDWDEVHGLWVPQRSMMH